MQSGFPEMKVGVGPSFHWLKDILKPKKPVWTLSAQAVCVFYWYKCKFETSIDLKDYPLLPVYLGDSELLIWKLFN